MPDDTTDLDPLDFDADEFDDADEDDELPPAAEVSDDPAETSEPATEDAVEEPSARFEELQRAAVRIRAGNIRLENELAQLEARLAEEEVAQ